MKTIRKAPFVHEAISASAGSGKTFQLAHRYIGLMAMGAPADRIIALTFSRKAAGEIFEAVVDHLCRAAASPEGARAAAKRLEMTARQRDFAGLLRGFLDHLHRLHIGTLDSFIVGVARAFPTELGVASGFQVLDTDGLEAAELRQQVLSMVFDPRRTEATQQRDFLEAFKQATFGKEEKSPSHLLDGFVKENRERFQLLPEAAAWDGGRIWPRNSPWRDPPLQVDETIEALLRHLKEHGPRGKALDRWQAFLEEAARFSPGAPLPGPLEYLLRKLLPEMDDLRRGDATLQLDKKECPLGKEECRLTLRILHHLIGRELDTCVVKTKGLHHLLRHFELLYDAQMRRAGRMTFSDAQYLLTASNPHSGGALLSRVQGAAGRLYIDYRLDCQLDHWLLDEFQDTSDLQWSVLQNLADEIVQDDTARRSFFYVGDIKQAIYGWRGGNARLFHRLLESYAGRIEERRLAKSYRSCSAVIDAVNRVFGGLEAGELPKGAVQRWAGIWQEHQCEPGKVPADGYAALVEPTYVDPKEKPSADDRYRVVAALLNEIQPLHRGLSVAILMRRNESGRQLVEVLRRECAGMTIAHEGSVAIFDNPVVAVLLALVKVAAHPGDTFAWRHVQMSPLLAALDAAGLARESLSQELLRRIFAGGMAPFLREWGAALNREQPLDDFGRRRWLDLVEAATAFDATGRREPDAFLSFMEAYTAPSAADKQAVRVMTIHQSKGLGFDVVIVPELMDRGLAPGDVPDVLVKRDPETEQPQWALKSPRRIVAEADPVLAAELRRYDEDAGFDALCVLYVALTRAKQGLYMVSSFPGVSSKSFTAAALLKSRLCGNAQAREGRQMRLGKADCTVLWETGNSAWFEAQAPRRGTTATEPAAEPPEAFSTQPSLRVRLSRVEPSAEERGGAQAAWLFSALARDVLEFGTAIHELFREVGWIEETDVEAAIRKWHARPTVTAEVRRDALEQFRRSIAAEEVIRALARPAGAADLWREKSFEVVLGGSQWVSGIFDRVTILRDAKGAPTRAIILDYKSDRVAGEAKLHKAIGIYRPQLELYRRALSALLRLDEKHIELQLLFTRAGRVMSL